MYNIDCKAVGSRTDAVVNFDRVGLCYPLQRGIFKGHWGHVLGRTNETDFWALRDVSFRIQSGGILGVVGRNGSGKSTMGRVIAGVFSPDEGTVSVRGRVSMLSPGTGFVADLTGRENILINGAYLGYRRSAMLAKMDEIIEFAGIGNFIDQPIRTYSTGMRSRLGFSITMSLDPDILIIDEVLSAGDAAFQRKAKEKLKGLVDQARAVIVIAHQMGFLKAICTEVLWLNKGKVVMRGDPNTVIDEYQASNGVPQNERSGNDSD